MSGPTPRGRVSITGIVMALVFLAVATVGFTGNPFWLLDEGTKWVVAGLLALVGLGLVASTVPGIRRRSKN
ncbi:hypothetical protein [Nakamurella deserti]|uniref:hypothetical protein n=1 Tax=Nakamurella deserti TaxID=2164074 RepID=UPI0013001DAD|nr:hypothetical protein [Nakamurella deserti]